MGVSLGGLLSLALAAEEPVDDKMRRSSGRAPGEEEATQLPAEADAKAKGR